MTDSSIAIDVEGIGKRYRLGEDLSGRRLLAGLGLGRARPDAAQQLWALRDVSFRVSRGEAVGIVGRNGAGKSTLLKILSRITPPTEGRATIRGGLRSLLEIGTGFSPELTGRENIYLNGAIIGMSRNEIERKFAEIVDFAGIERFLDTPVKRYSSGMYVRLAFGVAAHLEPDILIVDEVLAVGDAGFQRKCLQTLDRMAGEQSRTVLFVSHNLEAVRAFCRRAILLDAGRIVLDGSVDEVLGRYLRSIERTSDIATTNLRDRNNRTTGEVRFRSIEARGVDGRTRWNFRTGEDLELLIGYEVRTPVTDIVVGLSLRDAATETTITTLKATIAEREAPAGQAGTVMLRLPNLKLRPGTYALYLILWDSVAQRLYDVIDRNVDLPMLSVESDEPDLYRREGYVTLDYSASIEVNSMREPVSALR